MTGAERGFLLLGSRLGNPERRPLSTAQLRNLAARVRLSQRPSQERELEIKDLAALGYASDEARRILALLAEEDALEHYLRKSRKIGCVPLTWISNGYPSVLRERLGADSPAVLWTKGDISILDGPKLALVGSRDIAAKNRAFAAEVGRQAALQGYTLVSGNARGADRTAQRACLQHGGRVISIVADELNKQPEQQGVLYISEEDFDAAFTAQRAHSRNRVIHALADKVFVAQSGLAEGGTWAGTVKNLRCGWSPVFCFQDASEAVCQLEQLGAVCIDIDALVNVDSLHTHTISLFDQ